MEVLTFSTYSRQSTNPMWIAFYINNNYTSISKNNNHEEINTLVSHFDDY